MITVLKINRLTKEISGWFIAANFNDVARIAGGAGEIELASYCYSNEWNLDQIPEARFDLPISEGGDYIYTVLQ